MSSGADEPAAETDELIAAGLAGGLTYADAATAAGCSKSTVYRRMADAKFRARVAEFRREMVQAAISRATGAMTEAADSLVKIMRNTRTPPQSGFGPRWRSSGSAPRGGDLIHLQEEVRRLGADLTRLEKGEPDDD